MSHFDVRTEYPQKCAEGMAESVPADDLVFDIGAFKSWPNAFLQQAVRAETLFPVQPNGWKEEVAVAWVERLTPPVKQRLQNERMKWNGTARAFGLRPHEALNNQTNPNLEHFR